MNTKNLTGQRFGQLTVIEKTDERQERYILWRCKCDCGNEILVNSKRLKRGTVVNCGCIPKATKRNGPVAENLAGQQFGYLTVMYRLPNLRQRTRWMCRCECGVEKAVDSHELKSGKTKSCGCRQYKRERQINDVSGRKFGRLTALYPTARRDKKCSVYWQCQCDCGKELQVTVDRLLYGNYKSCGCLKRENQKALFEKLHLVDGTCVEWLEKRKHRRDNTSGFRGVDPVKNGKYRVTIGFRGQRYYMGIYDSFDEAVEVRKKAEDQLHHGFLEAYYAWRDKAEADPEWAKTHGFSYETKELQRP